METFYSRTELLIGSKNLAKLIKSKVIIIGIGAVGSYVTEALARAGIGEITLVDFDKVFPSNLNRQLVALNSTIGQYKVDVAEKRIKDINPDCKVFKKNCFVNSDNVADILSADYDVVVDAIDILTSKADIIEQALKNNIKIISSMGAGVKTSPYLFKCTDIKKTHVCPLAKRLRKLLRERGITEGVRCVFSTQSPVEIVKKSKDLVPPRIKGSTTKKEPIGTISYLTGIVGLIVAGEALKLILGDDIEF